MAGPRVRLESLDGRATFSPEDRLNELVIFVLNAAHRMSGLLGWTERQAMQAMLDLSLESHVFFGQHPPFAHLGILAVDAGRQG